MFNLAKEKIEKLTNKEMEKIIDTLIKAAKGGGITACAAISLFAKDIHFRENKEKENKEFIKLDGKTEPLPLVENGIFLCPQCKGESWDNRKRIESGQFSPKSPTFSCKDKQRCGWATWTKEENLKVKTAAASAYVQNIVEENDIPF